ncbi:MAG: hypothetical protein KME17_05985 [Cyanosarcina radialis HA8281-LM2]|jgi:hypothetical protein|nr:hypothetical protein [Cyanosarcina radialis HA8281-LM2]
MLRTIDLEQTLLTNLRRLPPEKQQQVLVFVQSLQTSEPDNQQQLRHYLVSQILPDLQRIHRDRSEPPSPVYADSLIRAMREMRDRSPHDPLTKIIMALHNAMTFENRWITYNGDQYQQAYILLKSLVETESLSEKDVQPVILALENLGFDTMPYTISTENEPEADGND